MRKVRDAQGRPVKSQSSRADGSKPIKTIQATAGQSFSFEATEQMKMYGSDGDITQEILVEPGDILTVTHNPNDK
jgi:hypothetical protein